MAPTQHNSILMFTYHIWFWLVCMRHTYSLVIFLCVYVSRWPPQSLARDVLCLMPSFVRYDMVWYDVILCPCCFWNVRSILLLGVIGSVVRLCCIWEQHLQTASISSRSTWRSDLDLLLDRGLSQMYKHRLWRIYVCLWWRPTYHSIAINTMIYCRRSINRWMYIWKYDLTDD